MYLYVSVYMYLTKEWTSILKYYKIKIINVFLVIYIPRHLR